MKATLTARPGVDGTVESVHEIATSQVVNTTRGKAKARADALRLCEAESMGVMGYSHAKMRPVRIGPRLKWG